MTLAPSAFAGAITFTRSTTGTYTNAAGIVTTVGVDTPRLEHSPSSLTAKGLLLEGASTNLCLHSSDYSQAAWSPTGLTMAPNATTAPDGTSTATKITENTSTGQHRLLQTASGLAVTSPFTVSFFAKAAEKTVLQIFDNTAGSAIFDLSTGVVSNITSGAVAIMEAYPNGWYRISYSNALVDAQTFLQIQVRLLINGGASASYTGDGTSGLFVWGAQAELLPFRSSYIPTAGSQVTRAEDSAIVSSDAFARMFNSGMGTVVAKFSYGGGASSKNSNTRNAFVVDSGSTANRLQLYNAGGRRASYLARIDSTNTTIAQDGPAVTAQAEEIVAVAIAYKSDDYSLVVNGAAIGGNALSGVPPLSRLRIGPGLFGHIRSLQYYPSRLSNAKMQELTL